MSELYQFYNEDCITGAQAHIADNSVDLIITDPPYGIGGHTLHKHYHRKEEYVLGGYVEIPLAEYEEFTFQWIRQAERILRPGGSIYILSGYTNLRHILNALHETCLNEVNHIIWKYNFGVYTIKKYVSSHYHILFYVKPGAEYTFNTHCRFGPQEKRQEDNGSLNYTDREDVWIIPREYKPGRQKNKNELPKALLEKIILYSSNEGDLVCDLFLGGFSTARIAIGLNRRAMGFELSNNLFDYQISKIKSIEPGELLKNLRVPPVHTIANQRKPWTEEEKKALVRRYHELLPEQGTKRKTIDALCKEFGRGYFGILNQLDQMLQ